jgi:ATP-binding cassette subfamily B (MDR/TAP) protein 1
MTLLFGNLTLAFVNFGKALQQAEQNDNASSAEAVREAGNLFKKSAAKDAIYLVCIGENCFHPYMS